MNRPLVRRVTVAAAAVIALLVLAGAIFTATFDVNRYKPQIVAAVKERTGRTLTFDGDLSLSLFPRIAVMLPATTLSEPGRDTVFARLQSAQASVALVPLLRRQFEVAGVRIDGLQATIVKQKDGRTNLDDLLQPQKPAVAPGQGGPAAPAGAATVGTVHLENADLTWRDLAAGRTVRLNDLDLRAGRYARGARMPVEASAAISANEPTIAARATFRAAIEWSEQGGLSAVRDLALKLDGTLKQQVVAIDARADRLIAGTDTLDVRGLKVSVNAKGEGGAPVELQLTAPRLEASPSRAAGERIELAVARRGTEPADAKVLIEGVGGTAARLEATTVKIAGSTRSAQRSTRFDVTTALVANVNDRTLRFDRASGEVVVDDPAFGPKPVRLPLTASGNVDGRRETVALQFEARGDGLSARGKLNTTGFAAPRIAFDVDADQVDADRYFLS
ncbi:MAG TPA: AsmA family protein, partial [Burkholderiaceae bacterium]|nr:AsmA family protein [Burkholderiaceae bacterium]